MQAFESAQATKISKPETHRLEVITRDAKTHIFDVRVAMTPAQQRQGLMSITRMPPMGGMVFPMQPPRVARFWMRNTLLPLDMIFIAPGGIIVKIATRRDTESDAVTSSDRPVSAVLEIAAGEAARLGIGVGDMVRYALGAF